MNRPSLDKSGADSNSMEADAKLRRMSQYIGEKVNVKTNFGSDFQGVFSGFDNHMNVILKDATEMRYNFLTIFVVSGICSKCSSRSQRWTRFTRYCTGLGLTHAGLRVILVII